MVTFQTLDNAHFGIAQIIRRILRSYDRSRDPDELDFLVYQVNKMYSILRAYDGCSSEVLEIVSVALSLLEDIQSEEYVGSSVPSSI